MRRFKEIRDSGGRGGGFGVSGCGYGFRSCLAEKLLEDAVIQREVAGRRIVQRAAEQIAHWDKLSTKASMCFQILNLSCPSTPYKFDIGQAPAGRSTALGYSGYQRSDIFTPNRQQTEIFYLMRTRSVFKTLFGINGIW